MNDEHIISPDAFKEQWLKAFRESDELAVALDLMEKIVALFPSKEIYIVGGVPRDLVMGLPISDVDLATNIPVEELEKHFELRNISKNDSQPVYTILHKGMSFDLAKFRKDSQTEAGRQNNISEEVDCFATDTLRRDLTINSLGIDYKGNIIDHQGGYADIKAGIIRCVGNPSDRYREDATRILRVFRFAAKLNFLIEIETAHQAIDNIHLLQDKTMISQESISREFVKVAKSGPALARFVRMLLRCDILGKILPEFTAMEGFDHDPVHHPEGDALVTGHILECLKVSPWTDPATNLAVLFHDFGKAVTRAKKPNGFSSYKRHEAEGVPIVKAILERLRFHDLSAEEKENILFSVEKHMLIHDLDKLNIKTLAKLIHNPAWNMLRSVGFCDEASRGEPLFNGFEFWSKIVRAEDKVRSVAKDIDELKKRFKQFIDGNRLLVWFPELNEKKPFIKEVLAHVHDFLIEKFNVDQEVAEDDVREQIAAFIRA